MSYIITYYLPSGLFVVVSWISFLIPPDIVPGRMALLITLFLVLINIFNNITTNSPKAEGLTAIEIWMLACILFVFGSLIEYAAILFQKQKNGPQAAAPAPVANGMLHLRGVRSNFANFFYDSFLNAEGGVSRGASCSNGNTNSLFKLNRHAQVQERVYKMAMHICMHRRTSFAWKGK